MANIDAAYLNAEQKKQRVEAGDSIYFPWGNRHHRAVTMNVSDIMGNSSTRYWYRIELTPGLEEESGAIHRLWIIPGDAPSGWNTPEYDAGWYQR